MEFLYKMIGVALVGGVTLNILRKNQPEMTMAATTAITVVMVSLFISTILSIWDRFTAWSSSYEGISDVYGSMVKIAGCSFISEVSAKLCIDSGMQTAAYMLRCGGTVAGISAAMPVYQQLINCIITILE